MRILLPLTCYFISFFFLIFSFFVGKNLHLMTIWIHFVSQWGGRKEIRAHGDKCPILLKAGVILLLMANILNILNVTFFFLFLAKLINKLKWWCKMNKTYLFVHKCFSWKKKKKKKKENEKLIFNRTRRVFSITLNNVW